MGTFWDFESYGDAPALIAETGARLTYRDLASLSDHTEASVWKSFDGETGLKPLTMFVCRNSPGAIAGYAALICMDKLLANLKTGLSFSLIGIDKFGSAIVI